MRQTDPQRLLLLSRRSPRVFVQVVWHWTQPDARLNKINWEIKIAGRKYPISFLPLILFVLTVGFGSRNMENYRW